MRRLTQFIFRIPGLRLGNFQMEILEASEKSRLTPTSTACGSSHPKRIAFPMEDLWKQNTGFPWFARSHSSHFQPFSPAVLLQNDKQLKDERTLNEQSIQREYTPSDNMDIVNILIYYDLIFCFGQIKIQHSRNWTQIETPPIIDRE